MTENEYIDRVLACLPRATPMRAQIGAELRGHIAERLAAGQPLEVVLRQLGDPARLAESYLTAVPLEPAPHGSRIAAKLIDALLLVAIVVPAATLAWLSPNENIRMAALVIGVLALGFGFFVYTIVAEWQMGWTLGKRFAGLQVVRENGAPIGGWQSVVRQLPVLLQIGWIDVLFALFTDKRQRAFELLSKTRVVRVQQAPGTLPGA